jgi:ubiquinone/menaquinone biosynthesis C-methylase UbiE
VAASSSQKAARMTAPGASSDPAHPSFVPRASFDLAIPYYDALIGWLLRDDVMRRALLDDSRIASGHQALELGCGTGELAVMLVLRAPYADVYALDSNPRKLARAIGKSWEAGHPFRVFRGVAQRLPFPSESIDRVYLSFLLSWLPRRLKLEALREARRVLFRDGSLHIVDFAPPVTRWDCLLANTILRFRHARPLLNGELPALLAETGFTCARQTGIVRAPAGRLARWMALP